MSSTEDGYFGTADVIVFAGELCFIMLLNAFGIQSAIGKRIVFFLRHHIICNSMLCVVVTRRNDIRMTKLHRYTAILHVFDERYRIN